MKIVIIEDEIAALEQLKALLMSNGSVDIEIVDTIDSVEDSIEFFRSERSSGVELVFMDIHLSDGYAFSIFKHVEVSIPIIFTTAYDEYALKSFEVNCIDYILKPISNRDIERIFSKLKVVAQYGNAIISDKKSLETILVLDSWRTVPLNIADVAYFYKDSSKVKAFNYDGKSFLTNMTLEKLEENIVGGDFIRANRQFIIAHRAVKNLESYEGSRAVVNLNIDTTEMIVISRTKVTAFKRWLKGEV